MAIYLSESCTEMGRNDSTLTIDSEGDQAMGNLTPLRESCPDETLIKSAMEPVLYASIIVEWMNIPIDLSLSETSV